MNLPIILHQLFLMLKWSPKKSKLQSLTQLQKQEVVDDRSIYAESINFNKCEALKQKVSKLEVGMRVGTMINSIC